MTETDTPRPTLAGPGESLVEARRSKFFGYARPLPDDPDELRRWLGEVRARHRDARHVVYAWRGTGSRSRGSDDGEPHGTGARPCQDALAQAGVEDAAVAVARIFGGVLLGAGNLGRAYAEAAVAAIADAGVRELRAHRRIHVRVGYGDTAAVERALRTAAVTDLEREGDAKGMALTGWVPVGRAPALSLDLREATGGRAEVRLGEEPHWR